MAIFLVITMTMLPYWGYIMPWQNYSVGLLILGTITIVGVAIKSINCLGDYVSAGVYVLAGLPVAVDADALWSNLIWPWNFVFFFGVFLYLVQLVIHATESCEIKPALFGYRELQHCILLLAVALHICTVVAVTT